MNVVDELIENKGIPGRTKKECEDPLKGLEQRRRRRSDLENVRALGYIRRMLMSGDSINMAIWGGDASRITAYIESD